MPSLTLPGTYNIRDLGGYTTPSGKQTKQRFLIRSGNLDKVPISSQQQLLTYGIRTVIDIRDEWEAKHYPNVFANDMHVRYLNVPLIGDALSNNAEWQNASEHVWLLELYIQYIERCKHQINAIFRAFAESEAAIIFHCHAGKDRTGIITALLLSCIGVADAAIATDYSLSSQQISHLTEEWRAYAVQQSRDMAQFEDKVASKPETILELLNYIRTNYGSSADYLRDCGLVDNTLKQLQHHFIA